MQATRHTARATSISWIPSEAIEGMSRLPFERGVAHYDQVPPDHLDGPEHLVALRDADRFRFANVISAWIDVARDGRITGWGQDGGGILGRRRSGSAAAPPHSPPSPTPTCVRLPRWATAGCGSARRPAVARASLLPAT